MQNKLHLVELLNKYNVVPYLEIVSINSKTTNNPKQLIEETRIKAKNNNRESLSEVLLKIDSNIKNSNQEKIDIFADSNIINLYNAKDTNLKNLGKILYNNFYNILSDLKENKIYSKKLFFFVTLFFFSFLGLESRSTDRILCMALLAVDTAKIDLSPLLDRT